MRFHSAAAALRQELRSHLRRRNLRDLTLDAFVLYAGPHQRVTLAVALGDLAQVVGIGLHRWHQQELPPLGCRSQHASVAIITRLPGGDPQHLAQLVNSPVFRQRGSTYALPRDRYRRP